MPSAWAPTTAAGTAGETGIDFNYGGAPDLQLTAVLPLAYDEAGHAGLGNIELAAKYKFLHQDDVGFDVAVFPRVFLPSASRDVGDDHAAFSLPFWAEKDWGKWCDVWRRRLRAEPHPRHAELLLRRLGADARGRWKACGWAWRSITRAPTTKGGKVSTDLGGGLTYDINEHYHLLAYAGPGLENAAETGRQDFYTAILFTF